MELASCLCVQTKLKHDEKIYMKTFYSFQPFNLCYARSSLLLRLTKVKKLLNHFLNRRIETWAIFRCDTAYFACILNVKHVSPVIERIWLNPASVRPSFILRQRSIKYLAPDMPDGPVRFLYACGARGRHYDRRITQRSEARPARSCESDYAAFHLARALDCASNICRRAACADGDQDIARRG